MNYTHKKLIDTVRAYALRYAMLDCTDIIVGYSGGADSSLLLYALRALAAERGIRLHAAHINHMLRAEAADSDEAFCRGECERMGIPFRSLRIDVRAIARERSLSEETAARDIRYGFFGEWRRELERESGRVVYVATAHNSTDNAETLIFNITRGTAIRGVTGIPPVRDSYIIRPLLSLSKADVLGYCDALGVEYVTDATNSECVYTRNRIRHKVLGELRGINPSLEEAVMRLCESVREDACYLDFAARDLYSYHTHRGGRALTREQLLSVHRAIRSRALCMFFEDNGAGYEHTHIESAEHLLLRGGDFSLSLIGGRRLVGERDVLRVEPDDRTVCETDEWECTLTLGENILPRGRMYVFEDVRDIEKLKTQNVYNLFIQQKLSGDTINNVFTARCRREGDLILSGGHHHKLKKLFSDNKIQKKDRALTPVVCRDTEVVWIPRLRTRDGEGKSPMCLYFAYTEE